MTKAEKKLAELEKRVEALEERAAVLSALVSYPVVNCSSDYMIRVNR